MRRRLLTLVPAVVLLAGLVPAAGHDVPTGTHSDNLTYIKTLAYEARNGTVRNYGTDIEFAELRVRGEKREFAFAGSYRNGLQIVDITEPKDAKIVGVYDCGVTQGDVQVFTRDDHPGRTFVTYTSDTYGDGTSTCYQEAKALGLYKNGGTKYGTFVADVTDPENPFTVSFVQVAKGSHNQTVHPSGKYLYNSNSDLITSAVLSTPAIEVLDITDLAKPKVAATIPLPIRPGLGTESHDLTFNAKGTRAYSAALSQGVIIDTTKPAVPSIIASFVDPSINVWHQSDPFSLVDATGKTRDYLVVEDEYAGAAGGPHCPSGGVHVFEVTGELEKNPRKLGYWNISDARTTTTATGRCTAHVFDIHEKEAIMTIAFYNGGVRVVDLSGLAGISLGDTRLTPDAGMRELAFYRFDNSDTWAAKTPHIQGNGDFYLYGNDINRGLDIFKFKAAGKPSQSQGRWMNKAEAEAFLAPQIAAAPASRPFCLLPQ